MHPSAPLSSTHPLIETRNLYKSYFNEDLETKVLYDISLKIADGEFVAIMGPSGSGKSTLMHILGFLDNPTSGDYLFRGEPTTIMDDDALARIRATRVSFVFQAFNLLPRTTVAENVLLPLLYHPTIPPSKRDMLVTQAIDSVGLAERRTYLTNQLSGGQQQRVAMARALVTEPDIIFADEPTGNLDSSSGIQVMSVLQKLNEQGHTIVLVTHEQTTARYAQRIISIRDGRIEDDSADHERIVVPKSGRLK